MERAMRAGRGRAFTLIELMVVMAIMGVLVALLVPTISRAVQIALTTQTTQRLREISFGLEAFKKQFGKYPPSGEGSLDTGAANLAYYLRGPVGRGWGTNAGGALPFGGRGDRALPAYYNVDDADLLYEDLGNVTRVAGFLDAFDPRGLVLDLHGQDRYVGRILYYLADIDEAGKSQFHVADNDVDPEAYEGYVNEDHFDLAAKGGGGEYVRKAYLLVSPGPDRKYGDMKEDEDTREYVPSTQRGICDDITNFDQPRGI